MNRFWNIVKNNITTVKHISAIGITDVVGSAISSVFWLYLASIMIAEEYGTIHYYIAIANIVNNCSLRLRKYTKSLSSKASQNTNNAIHHRLCI